MSAITTGIDRSDVTAALADLESRDVVLREVDPQNRRRKIVSITEAGVAVVTRLDALLDDIQQELLAPLSPDERKQLTTMMSRLANQ